MTEQIKSISKTLSDSIFWLLGVIFVALLVFSQPSSTTEISSEQYEEINKKLSVAKNTGNNTFIVDVQRAMSDSKITKEEYKTLIKAYAKNETVKLLQK